MRRLMVVGLACLGVAAVCSIALAAAGGGGTVTTCIAKTGWRAVDTGASCKSGEQQLDLYSKAGADAHFLALAGTAADSDKLDGLDSTAFLDVSGRVNGDGTVTAAHGGLDATPLDAPDPTLFLLQYPGFDPDSHPIVVLTPVGAYIETAGPTAEVIPSDDPDLVSALGEPPGQGIVVRVQTAAHHGGVSFNVVIKP